MNRRLAALVAAFVLLVSAATPGAARVAPSAPDAAAPPAPSMPASPTDQSKVPHYFGPWPNWANSQVTLPDVEVAINAAALPVAPILVGGPLIARQYATDNTVGGANSGTPGQGTVLVINPTALPTGTLVNFQTYTQTGTTFDSPGNTFSAYVLRPTGIANEYGIVYDSGPLTVPAEADGVHTWPVSVAVQQGDVIGFYGQGIPLDMTGTDVVFYPVDAAPTNPFVTATLPSIAPRAYSFGATVQPPNGAAPGSGAKATATIGANGAVTSLTLTNPGSGYLAAEVVFTGAGGGASATATVQNSGAVTSVTVLTPGAGYTQPAVSITGGGGVPDATGTAFGSVDLITLGNAGAGYTVPTVSIDFPDDPAGTQATAHVTCVETDCNGNGSPVTITGVVVDNHGSGYSAAPGVSILDGTLFDPVIGGTGATATATIDVTSVVLDTFGAGYTSAPDVAITDATGSGAGATASASTDVGAVSALTLVNGGSGYLQPGIRKFVDGLPGLCAPPACPTTGKYIPLAVPEAKAYDGVEADEYEIGLVQYQTSFSSSLPATLARGYIQLETSANAGISQHWPVVNTAMDGTTTPVYKSDGVTQWYAVTPPQWLGPTIAATRDRAVRIVFHNLLPTGMDGNLFLPVDSTLMGSGMGPNLTTPPVNDGTVMDGVRNPMCTEMPNMAGCFAQNRATLHLHGGITPWISDGTPHQWITPAGETTDYPQGVSVGNVPDMNVCTADDDGCQTFYYTNQQSARLMFYHDHAWGITRLNVYAGEAAGYLITDETEKKLITSGTIPGAADTIPLVVQDRTFVPGPAQLADQDPTWDVAKWGAKGSFWYHHVYMPAQNPGDPGGMSAYGRWMYGPWFWPPATPPNGPIANPYYDPACKLDDPVSWTYQTDPFCEPELIPGTPNISVGMEQFNDTPIVNGVAYPTITLEPKTYRLRMLNAANDRFLNFQWYVGDPTTASTALNAAAEPIGATEVALNPDELAAAQTDPVVFPTPAKGSTGPDWIQIGTEGGFLPAPTVLDGQQPTTWITDPTRFDVGNVDKHSLLLAPAERADAIVDFSKFAGKTLILYNDAPAAFPARVPSYDYYTGAPDTGAGQIIPGFGPNTRTIMQVKIAGSAAPAFNLTKLQNAFKHHADGSGVFESGQHPIIVGQAAYNSAYGTSFAASGNCSDPAGTNKCDGLARINQQGGDLFRFDNLKKSSPQLKIPLQPKALHDEMNSTAFDEYGRMTANIGLEAVPATPATQNVMLYPYVAPPTEVIDGTNLPKGDLNVQAISDGSDGTQIWKITHNGVDTHPIHFHLYDVQVLNRVTWDNIIIPTEASELGWKDTVRISPLEDTIVALRPIVPTLPFEIPNSIRPLSPMMPVGADIDPLGLIVDPQGNVTTVQNALVNFGWEYVYHCHILSHEEMDMMRPVLLALPPLQPDGLSVASVVLGNGQTGTVNLAWNDQSITETAFLVQRKEGAGAWTTIGTIASPLGQPNIHEARTFADTTWRRDRVYQYRVIAQNVVGYGGAYPSADVRSTSAVLPGPILAPTSLTATALFGPQVRLNWTDTSVIETGFVVQRSDNGGPFATVATAPARGGTGGVTYTDTTVPAGGAYVYQVAAVNSTTGGQSDWSNPSLVVTFPSAPAAPASLTAVNGTDGPGNARSVNLAWPAVPVDATGYTVQRSPNATFTGGAVVTTPILSPATTTYTSTGLSRNAMYYFRIRANNGPLVSSTWTNANPFPITTNP
jgi:FtsP/CotA-like multicopper oxidase with cupredoxin domain